jgi:hypothetical protein
MKAEKSIYVVESCKDRNYQDQNHSDEGIIIGAYPNKESATVARDAFLRSINKAEHTGFATITKYRPDYYMTPTPSQLQDLSEAIKSAQDAICLDSRDYSLHHRDAWIYGILVGWDEDQAKMAQKHWSISKSDARLTRYHKAVETLQRLFPPRSLKEQK